MQFSAEEKKQRRDIYALYIVFAALVLTAVLLPLTLVLAIGASLRRKKLKDTSYDSHLLWIIYTFIILIVGMLLMAIFQNNSIGQHIVLGGCLALILYRLAKGVFYLKINRPIHPKSIL